MGGKGTVVSKPRTHVRPPNAPIRCLGALALVWALSFAMYPIHLTALAAATWTIATLALVPIGTTLTDRMVAFLLLGAAPATLIAWFTPFVPWLASAPVLTGLLGSLVALAWGLGWTRRPVTRLSDAVTIGLGVLTAGFYWIPFSTGGFARTIGVLAQGYDTQVHYLLWMRVWANHGYLVLNTLPDPDAWIWRTYPQGAHAVLADIGAVITGENSPPVQIESSIMLFAFLVCLEAGALALVTAWSVDRLSRSRKNPSGRRVVIFQVLAALFVAAGPGSVVVVHSLSFAIGLIVIIPAFALAAVARSSPRLSGVLIGVSVIAVAAIYPILALLAGLVWPLYLWTSRRFWLVGKRRRWYGAGSTAVVAVFCAPMFVLLVLRQTDHGWETFGYFQALHVSAYVGPAILLALLIVFAKGRLPGAVQYALWLAGTASIALIIEGILQLRSEGQLTYYTVKTMYFVWMLSLIAVGAGLASIRKRSGSTQPSRGHLARRISSWLVAGVLVVGTILVSVPLAGIEEGDATRVWSRALSKEGYVIVNARGVDKMGSVATQIFHYAAQHDGLTIVVPCLGASELALTRWGLVLTGGFNEAEMGMQSVVCQATEQAHLGLLPGYLQEHPEVTVNVLALDQEIYDYALREKKKLDLSNLNVVPLFESPKPQAQNWFKFLIGRPNEDSSNR